MPVDSLRLARMSLPPRNRVLIPPTPHAPELPLGRTVLALSGRSMGMAWNARLAVAQATSEAALRTAIEDELSYTAALFSHWEADSELSRFNRSAPGPWLCSDDFWHLIQDGLALAQDSGGAVDPTLGRLVQAWGFGPSASRHAPAAARVPEPQALAAALQASGWTHLQTDPVRRALLQPGGLWLDLGGLAKGWAVDRISQRLADEGAASHLFELGGECRARGVRPDGQPWWVELENPPGAALPRTLVALLDLALATSGDYRQCFEHGGRHYSHTLDGRTGQPADHGWACVSVLHERALMADAYATALGVLGVADGLSWANHRRVAARLVQRTPSGWIEHVSDALAAMLEETV